MVAPNNNKTKTKCTLTRPIYELYVHVLHIAAHSYRQDTTLRPFPSHFLLRNTTNNTSNNNNKSTSSPSNPTLLNDQKDHDRLRRVLDRYMPNISSLFSIPTNNNNNKNIDTNLVFEYGDERELRDQVEQCLNSVVVLGAATTTTTTATIHEKNGDDDDNDIKSDVIALFTFIVKHYSLRPFRLRYMTGESYVNRIRAERRKMGAKKNGSSSSSSSGCSTLTQWLAELDTVFSSGGSGGAGGGVSVMVPDHVFEFEYDDDGDDDDDDDDDDSSANKNNEKSDGGNLANVNRREKEKLKFFETSYFHGTGSDNIYSILSSSLLNLSETKMMQNGNVHGSGIYFCNDIRVARNYSKVSHRNYWSRTEILGRDLSAVFECNVHRGHHERDVDVQSDGRYLVVRNGNCVRIKNLLLYTTPTSTMLTTSTATATTMRVGRQLPSSLQSQTQVKTSVIAQCKKLSGDATSNAQPLVRATKSTNSSTNNNNNAHSSWIYQYSDWLLVLCGLLCGILFSMYMKSTKQSTS